MPIDPELARKFIRDPQFQQLEPREQLNAAVRFLELSDPEDQGALPTLQRRQAAAGVVEQFEPGFIEKVPVVGEVVRAFRAPEEARPLTKQTVDQLFGPGAVTDPTIVGLTEAVRTLVENVALFAVSGPIGRGVATVAGRAVPSLSRAALRGIQAAAEGGSDLALFTLGSNIERVTLGDEQLSIVRDLLVEPTLAGALGAAGGVALTGVFRGFLDDATRITRAFEATGVPRQEAADVVSRGMAGRITVEEFDRLRGILEEQPRLMRSSVGQQIIAQNRELIGARLGRETGTLRIGVEFAEEADQVIVNPSREQLDDILQQAQEGRAFIRFAEGEGAEDVLARTRTTLGFREEVAPPVPGPLGRGTVGPEGEQLEFRLPGEQPGLPLRPGVPGEIPPTPSPEQLALRFGRAISPEEQAVVRTAPLTEGFRRMGLPTQEVFTPPTAGPRELVPGAAVPPQLTAPQERALTTMARPLLAEQIASDLPAPARALGETLRRDIPQDRILGERFVARRRADEFEERILPLLATRERGLNVPAMRSALGLPNTPDVTRRLGAVRRGLIDEGLLTPRGQVTEKGKQMATRGLLPERTQPPSAVVPEGTTITTPQGPANVVESNELFTRVQREDGTVEDLMPRADGELTVSQRIEQKREQRQRVRRSKKRLDQKTGQELTLELRKLEGRWAGMKEGPARDGIRTQIHDIIAELDDRVFDLRMRREAAEGGLADQFREGCD